MACAIWTAPLPTAADGGTAANARRRTIQTLRTRIFHGRTKPTGAANTSPARPAMSECINWKARAAAVAAADGDEWDRLSEAYDEDWIAAYRAAMLAENDK